MAARSRAIHGAVAPDDPTWNANGTSIVEAFPIADSGSDGGRRQPRAVRADGRLAGLRRSRGRQPAANADFIDAVYGSFPLMIALIAISTFILLARAFRSILLPIKAIILNILSVGAAWGVLALVWQNGNGSELIWGTSRQRARFRRGSRSWCSRSCSASRWTTRCSSSAECERSTTARARRTTAVIQGIGRTGPARHQRGADPVPRVHRDGLGAGHRRPHHGHGPGRRASCWTQR